MIDAGANQGKIFIQAVRNWKEVGISKFHQSEANMAIFVTVGFKKAERNSSI